MYAFENRGHPSTLLTSLSTKFNILINETGHPLIAGFGLLSIIPDPTNLSSSNSYVPGGTPRWMSPELIHPEKFGFENDRPTIYSDCYALGMVIYETISGNVPFHEYRDIIVFRKVLEGERPPRGAWFTNSLWEVLERCWDPQPKARPSLEDVLRCLEMEPHSVGRDVEMEVDGVEEDSDSDGSLLLDLEGLSGKLSPFPPAKSHDSCSHMGTLKSRPTNHGMVQRAASFSHSCDPKIAEL